MSSPKLEKRFLAGTELRADSNNFSISGTAASYGVTSRNLGGFVEQIQRGAFARSLREKADVRCLFNHNCDQILGRTAASTLTLTDSDIGLKFRCMLSRDIQVHQNVYTSIARGDVSDMSFAFLVAPNGDVWQGEATDERGTKLPLRTLVDVDLQDISPVVFAAYPQTSVAARALPDYSARGWNAEATFRRLTAQAITSVELKDEERRVRAAQLVRSIEAEKEEEQELENACERACRAAGLDFCSVDDEHIYAGDANEPDENCCYRFEYEQGDDGEIVLDLDSRAKTSHELLHSERGRRILWLRSLKRKAGRNG